MPNKHICVNNWTFNYLVNNVSLLAIVGLKTVKSEMDKQKSETKKSSQQLFHFDEHNIEQICASLENGMNCMVKMWIWAHNS